MAGPPWLDAPTVAPPAPAHITTSRSPPTWSGHDRPGDLTRAGNPVLRTLASPGTSSWRPTTDRRDLEDEARAWLEQPGEPDAEAVGGPTTWAHPSGEVAVQFEVAAEGGGTYVATVLFTAPEA